MSNIISSSIDSDADISMSTGLTTVFMEVLVLAGSDMASTDWERALVHWFAQHDQSLVGGGVVGFDVTDLGWTWTEPSFAEKQNFIFRIVDAALARHGWDRLPYEPHEERLFEVLRQFRAMVSALTDPVKPAGSWLPAKQPPGMCSKHRVYKHRNGCIICRNTPRAVR
jgi:hypothetical protein